MNHSSEIGLYLVYCNNIHQLLIIDYCHFSFQTNQHYKIGHLLCRSRNPDFLLDILQKQGTNQAMPWLADLVESSEGSFNVLPVQCLCEFLLNSVNMLKGGFKDQDDKDVEFGSSAVKKHKQRQLLLHLQDLLHNPQSDQQACMETLEYFLRRLSSQQTRQRLQALQGLRLVLTPVPSGSEDLDHPDDANMDTGEDKKSDWLLKQLPALPIFRTSYTQISQALRVACQVENDPNAVSLYIQFLSHYAPESLTDLTNLCLDMASIIVERSTLLPAILPGSLRKTSEATANETYRALIHLLSHYMDRVRRQPLPPPPGGWSDTSEMFTIVWSEGYRATIHYFIVLAQIILLTYGPPPRYYQVKKLL